MEIENLQSEPVAKSRFIDVAAYLLMGLFTWRLLTNVWALFNARPIVRSGSTPTNESVRAILRFVAENLYLFALLSIIIATAGLIFSYFFLKRQGWARKGLITILWYNIIVTVIALSATLYSSLYLLSGISNRLSQTSVSPNVSFTFVYVTIFIGAAISLVWVVLYGWLIWRLSKQQVRLEFE